MPKDPNQLAKTIMEMTVAEPESPKNPAAVALGKLGGAKGGPARAQSMTPERRKEIAQKAAQARWAKKDTNQA